MATKNKQVFTARDVELVITRENLDEQSAQASVSLNPHVTWMKVVLTDSLPNGNKQGIPEQEFSNILKTGVFMPVKMAKAEIKPGHEDAEPIGSMAHLMVEDNTVVALAALWKTEREEDVDYLKQRYDDGKPIDVSWEITYTNSEASEDGVTWLKGVSMNAITIVSRPAYQGRTPVTEMASEQDESNLEDEMELEQKVKNLEQELETKTARVTELEAKAEEVNTELEELRAFKAEVEARKARAEKLQTIRTKLEEAGLEDVDTYLTEEKAEQLLAMDEATLSFMMQELAVFRSKAEKAEDEEADETVASVSLTGGDKIPNVKAPAVEATSVLDYLRKTTK